ncbi:hypothetical protein FRC07_011067, partial [Ceratobasidium sp. 392]
MPRYLFTDSVAALGTRVRLPALMGRNRLTNIRKGNRDDNGHHQKYNNYIEGKYNNHVKDYRGVDHYKSTASVPSSSIPAGAITVGSGGKYSTIAAALKDTSSNIYYIYAGTYKEQILISRANVKIYGQTSNALDYTANTVTITNNIPASQAGSNDASGTVRVSATGVSLYNLNIANTYGKPVDQAQAIALSVQAGTFGAYACKITGYQDTLLANKGTQFYGRTYINGATDFSAWRHPFGSQNRLSKPSPADISPLLGEARTMLTTMSSTTLRSKVQALVISVDLGENMRVLSFRIVILEATLSLLVGRYGPPTILALATCIMVNMLIL